MRRVLAVITLMLSTSVALADKAYLFVEDGGKLKPPPREVVAALANPHVLGNDDKFCKLVGKRISLTGSTTPGDYFVTTANGCSWGSAAGPFWLVHRTKNSYMEVLESGGAMLRLKDETRHGLKSIVVIEGNAGVYGEDHLEFDGKKYQVKWSRHGSRADWCGESCPEGE